MKNKNGIEKTKPHVTSGSIFDDLGLSVEDSAVAKMKAELLDHILKIVERNGYSGRDLEKILDKPQPRISELITGKISKLSLDTLVLYLDSLGEEIRVNVKSKKKGAA